jgi:hypothetical protein
MWITAPPPVTRKSVFSVAQVSHINQAAKVVKKNLAKEQHLRKSVIVWVTKGVQTKYENYSGKAKKNHVTDQPIITNGNIDTLFHNILDNDYQTRSLCYNLKTIE